MLKLRKLRGNVGKPKQNKLASKVCPMSFAFSNWVISERNKTGHIRMDCLREKCAWWNEGEECCAIKTLNLRKGPGEQDHPVAQT